MAKKFDTYCWNYDRIAPAFREDFLVLVSAEFTLALKEGLLDEALYAPEEWQRLVAIIDDPRAVFANDVALAEKAAADSSRSSLLPQMRDDIEKVRSELRKAISQNGAERYGDAASRTVSVVIPVYNAEPFLDKLFDSLLAQTHEKLQIICVDDGSSDGSLAKLREYAAADSRIEIVGIENSGAGAARNIGIEHATGDYLCFVDADDYVENDLIARTVDIAEEHDLEVVLFGIDEYDDRTHGHRKMWHAVVKGKVPYNEVFNPRDVDDFFVNMTGFTVNKLYRMSYFERLGVRFPSIGAHEDMPFTYAAVGAAERVYYLDEVLYHYRLERAESRSETTMAQYRFMLQAAECMQRELERLGLKDVYERDFANYALSLIRWKFNTISGKNRRDFHRDVFADGLLERFGIAGRNSSYFFDDENRRFYLSLITKSYVELLEQERAWIIEELEEVLGSKSFALGERFATPFRSLRSLLLGDSGESA